METPAVYVQGIVLELLKAALTGVDVVTDITPAIARKVGKSPVLLVSVWSTSNFDVRFSTLNSRVQLDAFLPVGKQYTAFDTLSDALSALRSAWQSGTVTAHGTIARIESISGPTPFPSSTGLSEAAADEVTRWMATVALVAEAV